MAIKSEKIALSNYLQWHDKLVESHGHYVSEPFIDGDDVVVKYQPGKNYKNLHKNNSWRVVAHRIMTTRIKSQ